MVDNSCWYINPCDINNIVINQRDETVKLNTEQTRSDYQFFRELHLKQNRAFTAYLYECIVYGHNFRNGYIEDRCDTEEEAILTIRLEFTKDDLKIEVKQ